MITATKTKKLKPTARHERSGSYRGLSRPARTLPIQAKLTIGKPNDKYEQEADRVADKVVSMPAPSKAEGPEPTTVQRKCAACEAEDKKVQKKSLVATITPWVQKQVEDKDELKPKLQLQEDVSSVASLSSIALAKEEAEEEDKEIAPKLIQKQEDVSSVALAKEDEEDKEIAPKLIQKQDEEDKEIVPKLIQKQKDVSAEALAKAEKLPVQTKRFSPKSNTPSPSLESRLGSSKSGGNSLTDDTRSFMESRIGADFGKVKVHTDSNAVQMSKELSAQAFTQGNHVYFNSGKYNPTSSSGKHLLAHELMHTLQQGNKLSPKIQRQGNDAKRIYMYSLYKDNGKKSAGITDDQIKTTIEYNDYIKYWSKWGMDETKGLDACRRILQKFDSGIRGRKVNYIASGREALRAKKKKKKTPARMGIDLLKAPQTTGDCGGVLSQVRWTVPSNNADGTIVQHLNAGYSKLEDCSGTKKNSIFHPNDPFHFYEAWEVKSGKIYVGWSNTGFEHRSDTFSGLVDYGSGTRGKGKATGKVAFLKGYNKSTETGWGPHKFAGNLPTRTTAPAGWSTATKFDHWLSTEWDCCPSGDRSKWTKTKVDGTPK